jgi:hypothetical protein
MPPIGGVRSGAGGISMVLEPPVPFILRQSELFKLALEDLTFLWDRFEPLMQDLEERVWETQGFGEWPPLADSTIEQKARHGWSLEPMVRTGALRDSMTDPGAASERTPKSMTWGTDIDYAHWHQEGGTTEGRPPQRQIIPDPLPVDERRKFEQAMVSYVNDASRRTWGTI